MDPDTNESSGIDRRTMLRRAAIGGAVVWATPVVQTIGMSSAAAGTIEYLSGCPGESCRPTLLRFKFEPQPCTSAPALTDCSSNNVATPIGDATVTAYNSHGNASYNHGPFEVSQDEGTIFEVVASPASIQNNKALGMNLFVTITFDNGHVQELEIHTSCSDPLNIGDRYGSLLFLGGRFGGEASQAAACAEYA